MVPVMTSERVDASAVDADVLLDALLFSVSHDLKSPLLTVLLSGELLEGALAGSAAPDGDERSATAFRALRSGARDLERMLDAVTAITQARRRPLEHDRVPLWQLAGGCDLRSDHPAPGSLDVLVDASAGGEFVACVAGETAATLHVTVGERDVSLSALLPPGCPPCEGSPLEALLGALRIFAGTPVESLAALEALYRRQGGAMRVDGARVSVSWPLAADA